MRSSIRVYSYFNCTIQELKQRFQDVCQRVQSQFQLHHTGIKTFANAIPTTGEV